MFSRKDVTLIQDLKLYETAFYQQPKNRLEQVEPNKNIEQKNKYNLHSLSLPIVGRLILCSFLTRRHKIINEKEKRDHVHFFMLLNPLSVFDSPVRAGSNATLAAYAIPGRHEGTSHIEVDGVSVY